MSDPQENDRLPARAAQAWEKNMNVKTKIKAGQLVATRILGQALSDAQR